MLIYIDLLLTISYFFFMDWKMVSWTVLVVFIMLTCYTRFCLLPRISSAQCITHPMFMITANRRRRVIKCNLLRLVWT